MRADFHTTWVTWRMASYRQRRAKVGPA
jgi:hypothetical protein